MAVAAINLSMSHILENQIIDVYIGTGVWFKTNTEPGVSPGEAVKHKTDAKQNIRKNVFRL